MTGILEAMQSQTVLESALAYQEAGLSVLPVKGKQNTVKWAKLQIERPTPGLIHWWHQKGLLTGVGIICGRVSGNLVVIDLDGLDAVAEFEKTFPYLLDTLTVKSGSGKGKHLYFLTAEYVPTTRTQGFEIRSDGCYVVAPPSIHPQSCLAYGVERPLEPRYLPHLNQVREWIRLKIRAKAPTPLPPAAVGRASAYAAAALRYECDNVRRAQPGSANNVLYRAALRIGNFVALGTISRSDVENSLMAAAAELSARDGEAATLRTIQSGLNTGIVKGRR